jgi:hypothetical protein
MHVKRSEEMHGVLYNEKLDKNERKWVGLRLFFLIFFMVKSQFMRSYATKIIWTLHSDKFLWL